MAVQFGLRVNQRNQAVTQYTGYEFNSMAVWGDRPIAIDENGIYELFTGDTDNGREIDARVDFPQLQLGTLKLKRIRAVVVGARVDGTIRVAVEDDDKAKRRYYTPSFLPGNQQLLRTTCGRNFHKGCYYTIGVENVQGSDFHLDLVQAEPIYLARKPARF